MKSGLRPWLILAAALVVRPALAGGLQSLAAVEQAAVQQVRKVAAPDGARVVTKAQPLDDRLRLAACAGPLDASVPGGRIVGNRVSVEVSCTAPRHWMLRVTVAVKIYRKVLVTTHALARGDHLDAGDVAAREYDVTRLGYGYVSSLAQAAGRAVVRPLRAGMVLAPGMLAHRELVHRGDRVAVVAGAAGVQVRAVGVALGGGDHGERIEVRNASSGKTLDATVIGAGVVRALP